MNRVTLTTPRVLNDDPRYRPARLRLMTTRMGRYRRARLERDYRNAGRPLEYAKVAQP